MKENFTELDSLIDEQGKDLQLLSKLVLSDSLKYVSRPIRDELLRRIINRMGEIEDSTMAIIKTVRSIKRARLNDDKQISNLMMNLAAGHVLFSRYSRVSNIAQLLETSPPVPEPLPVTSPGVSTTISNGEQESAGDA